MINFSEREVPKVCVLQCSAVLKSCMTLILMRQYKKGREGVHVHLFCVTSYCRWVLQSSLCTLKTGHLQKQTKKKQE